MSPIIFQIIDWNEYNESIILDYDEETGQNVESIKYTIRIYGRDQNNKSVFVNIEDFKPYFFIKIPDNWTDATVRKCIIQIKKDVYKNAKEDLFKYEIILGKEFYGFTNEKEFKFLKLIFNNIRAFYAYEKVIDTKDNYIDLFDKPTKFQIYESNIKPFMRFIHEKDLLSCGWIKIEKYSKAYISYCDISIRTNWDNIEFYENQTIQQFIIASYDIECTSASGKFPVAQIDEDYITQIGTVFQRYGEPEPYLKHIITLKGCNKQFKGLEDVEVESYNTEKEVLLAWKNLILRTDPDIITGYNINGFDFKYIYDRAVKLNIITQFQELGRIKNEKSKFVEKELGSKAMGQNKLYYFEMSGRVVIDLMKYAQRELKLDNFKLDNVSSTYIKEKIIKCLFEKDDETIIITDSSYGISEDYFITVIFFDGLTDNKHDEKYKILSIEDAIYNDKKCKKVTVNGIIPTDILEYKKVWWCLAKDDISLKQLFSCITGTNDDRALIAKYCVMDCILVLKLMEKLKVINNNIAMANVCNVPLSYIFLRGQSVKILSLVSKECRRCGYFITKLKKYDDTDEDVVGYEGAIVFEPKTGIYYDPIVVLDYASLYPNSMICYNICHSCIVLDEQYLNLENYIYREVRYMEHDTSGEDLGEKVCIYAEKKTGEKGIVPNILKELLNKRDEVKKMMKNTNNDFLKKIYDGLQLAYKVTANSLYGQLGAKTSAIYLKELAASTTAVGRQMLDYSKNFIENDYKNLINKSMRKYDEFSEFSTKYFEEFPDYRFVDKSNYKNKEEYIKYFYDKVRTVIEKGERIKPEVIYGDSVVGDTPILLKLNDQIYIKTIDDIGKSFKSYEVFKNDIEGLTNKEMDDDIKYQVWTDKGWANIKKVIRHNTNKRIFGVLTHTGYVRVTEDHSLLTDEGKQIKPEECKIGTKLLHAFPEIINEKENKILLDKAYIYGFFFGDGSCGKYGSGSSVKYSWALNNADMNLNIKLIEKLENIYPEDKFKIVNTMESSGVYKMVPSCGNIKKFVEEYRDIFYDKNKLKIIPMIILNGSLSEKISFLDGYYAADGCRSDTDKCGCHRFDIKGQISAMNMYYLVKSIGYNVSINNRKDKEEIFRLTYSKNKFRKDQDKIKKITDLGYINDFVYDLETDVGHFHAGIGCMIVKNTDSVFFDPKIYNKKTKEIKKDTLKLCIELGQLAGEAICKTLPEPEKQVYEKTLFPFILIAKKKYVGNLYEDDDSHFEQKSMGIVLKRRDNAKIVKIVVGGIVDCILNKRDNQKALDYTKETLKKLLKGEYPIDKFIVSKTLKETYKNRKGIAHAVLSDRIKERDPGNAPNVNDRVPYVYFINKTKSKLQGDKIEDPKYLLENDLEIDYLHYITNQIQKPSMQFLELIAENANKIFTNLSQKEVNRRKKRTNILECFDNASNSTNEDIEINSKFTIDNCVSLLPKEENNKKPKKTTRKNKIVIEIKENTQKGFIFEI